MNPSAASHDALVLRLPQDYPRQSLTASTDVMQEICQAAVELFKQRLPAGRFSVPLLGVGVSEFDNPGRVQQTQFDGESFPVATRLAAD